MLKVTITFTLIQTTLKPVAVNFNTYICGQKIKTKTTAKYISNKKNVFQEWVI